MLDIAKSFQSNRSRRTIGWLWIWHCLNLRKLDLISILILTMLIYACGAIIPICTQHAIDRILRGSGYEASVWLAAIAVMSVVVDIGLSNFRHKNIIRLGAILDKRLTRKMLLRLLQADLSSKKVDFGDLLVCLQRAGRIRNFALQTVPQLLFDIGGSFISLLILACYDKQIAAVVTVIIFSSAILLNSRRSAFHASAKRYHECESRRSSLLSETVNFLYTVKAQSLESGRFEQWREAANQFINALRDHHHLGRRFGMSAQVVTRVINLVVICLGAVKLSQKQITVGELLAIQMLSSRIAAPILNSSDVIRQLSELNVAIKGLDKIFSLKSEIFSNRYRAKPLITGGIVAEKLSFRYPGANSDTLSNLCFTLPTTGFVAIVGKNGCGKSTLMRVLSGIARTYTGNVFVSDQELRSYHPRWYRKRIGIVEQDTNLFVGDIRSNVAASNPDLDDREILRALEFSQASEFVSNFSSGLSHRVIEGGSQFSGGQKQRLAISRALAKNPNIIFLDEPTAFLDPEAGVALEHRLVSLGKSKLIVMITHHIPITVNADLILVLDSGRLISHGKHRDLLLRCDVFRNLWENSTRISLHAARVSMLPD